MTTAEKLSEDDVKILSDLKNKFEGLSKATDKVKQFAEELPGKMEKRDKITEDLKGQVDEQMTSMNGLKEEISALGQKLSEVNFQSPSSVSQLSLGHQFVANDDFKQLGGSEGFEKSKNLRVDNLSISTLEDSAGALIDEQRLPMVDSLSQPLNVRGLFARGTTTAKQIEYAREKSFDNQAGTVAEMALKPQSDLDYELITAKVIKIAHYIKASTESIDDAPGLASQINNRLVYGVGLREEAQLLYGSGTGNDLQGAVPVAQDYVLPADFNPDELNMFDILRLAILQTTLGLYPASGIVLHDTAWARIQLQKDKDGNYLSGSPTSQIGPMLWNLPVATSLTFQQNDFLVGAFNTGAQIFDRKDVAITLSTENENDFVRNMMTILAEKRLTLAHYRTDSFVKGQII